MSMWVGLHVVTDGMTADFYPFDMKFLGDATCMKNSKN
jgi:hypothetical protein